MNRLKPVQIGIKLISAIAMLAMVLISIAVYHASISGLFIFLLFSVFYVHLPGMCMLRLLGIKLEHFSVDMLVSFFTGWSLIVIEYFIGNAMNSNILLAAAGPVMLAVYIAVAAKKRGVSGLIRNISIRRLPTSLFILTTMLMLYVLLITQFVYMSPERAASVSVSIDKAYQMGLITSITHGFPVVDPWIANRLVNYHIFSQILLSAPMTLFGMDVDFIVMSGVPYLTAGLMALSPYALFRQFCNRKERAGLYALSILLANMFAARDLTTSYLFRVVIGNDNYGGFALASLVSCLIVLDHNFKNDGHGHSVKVLILFTLQIFLLSGIKAPVGLVLIGGLIGSAVMGFILRKVTLIKAVPLLASSLASFLLVYKYLLNLNGSSSSSNGSIFSLGDIANLCFWKSDLISLLKSYGIPVPLRMGVLLLGFMAVFLTIFTLPFIMGYIREFFLVIRGKVGFSFPKVTIYATSLVGLIMMLILKYSGHSQIYFGSVLMYLAPLIAFWFFENVSLDSHRFTRALAGFSKVYFFITIILTSVMLVAGIRDMLPDAIKHADPSSKFSSYRSMTAGEYEAVRWIRDNISYDSMLATQMYASVKDEDYDIASRWHNCHFLYAAYSDRRFYLEGSGFSFEDFETELRREMVGNTKLLYDPSNNSRAELATDLGIDYVMVTKKLHPTPDLTSDDYSLVFSNEDVDIYKVSH